MEGRYKTEYPNHFLQIASGRNAVITMFGLLQVATHLPVTKQFVPHAFQFLPLLFLMVMEAPHSFASCKVWDYEWLGVVDA